MPYNASVLTIVETPSFVTAAERLWPQEERLELFAHLAADPTAGEVIPGSGGCLKLRWSRPGSGKRGGTQIRKEIEDG